MHMSSLFHHLVVYYASYLNSTVVTKFQEEPVSRALNRQICDFQSKSPFILERIQYSPMVIMDH